MIQIGFQEAVWFLFHRSFFHRYMLYECRIIFRSYYIRQYMIIYCCIVLLPPVIIVARNLRMINGLRKLMEESVENRKFAMQWFYRDVRSYKEMYEGL